MLKELKADYWGNSFPWGNGHTVETDPTRRGWRLRGVNEHVAVVGRTGVPGCMSVMPVSGGRYDIAVYDELKPEEAFKRLKAGERLIADEYKQTASHSGWALPLIQSLE